MRRKKALNAMLGFGELSFGSDSGDVGRSLGEPQDASGRFVALTLAVLISAGLVLRFWNFSSLSLTYDELITSAFYLGAPDGLTYQSLINVYCPEQPPAFHAVLRAWVGMFGRSVVAIRLLPLLLSVVTILLPYFFTSRLFGKKAGLVATLCFVLSPMNIWWAQGARANTAVVPLAILGMYSLLMYLDTDHRFFGVGFVAANVVLAWVSLTGVFLVAAELIFLVLSCRGRFWRSFWLGFAMSVAMLPSALWVRSMPHFASAGAGRPSLMAALSSVFGNDSMHLNADIPRPDVGLPLWSVDGVMNWALAAAFILAILWLCWRLLQCASRLREANRERALAVTAYRYLLLLLVIVLPPLFAYLTARMMRRDLLFSRYTMYTWPALYAAVGVAVCSLRRRWLRQGAVVALLALYVYQIPLLIPTTRRADWLGAVEHVRAHASSEDAVIATGEYLSGEMFDANMRAKGVNLGLPIISAGSAQAAVNGALYYLCHCNASAPEGPGRSVWLVLQRGSASQPNCPEIDEGLAALGLDYSCCALVAGDTLLVYRIRLKAGPQLLDKAAGPVDIAEPNSLVRVDYEALLNGAFAENARADRRLCRDTLASAAVYMYHDPMDPVVWSLGLLAAGKPRLAVSAANLSFDLSPHYPLAHLARACLS